MLKQINIYTKKRLWKWSLLVLASLIAFASLWYTNHIVKKLATEELKKVELVANATKNIANASTFSQDLSFSFEVIQNNHTIPVILIDEEQNVMSWRNLDSSEAVNNPAYLKEVLEEMRDYHDPIEIKLPDNKSQQIFFKPSVLIDLLKYYPYVQLSIISIFILIAYFAFSSSRNAEQNQVWVGMSKETAHQLGTPLSSLYGWLELLKADGVSELTTAEIEKDLNRLTTVTNRFSKIGSQPRLTAVNLQEFFERNSKYLQGRLSKTVDFTLDFKLASDFNLALNEELFEWVIENLCKNAVDAMGGEGKLQLIVNMGTREQVHIDIIDTGKGIAKSEIGKVFKPGFTTKKRGWGLGLSLVQRIVEQYHFGKVYVRSSELGVGTNFRISLYPDQIAKRIA